MRYRNVKTGDVIDSPCVISGSNWEPVEENTAVFPDGDAAMAEVSEEKPPRPRRAMTTEEQGRAQALLDIVSASLRVEACKVGKDLDAMVAESDDLAAVAKSVTVDVVARTLMTSTDQEPMTQMSQTAGPYSTSGTFLVPGGGLFIKRSELARLGLRRQKCGVMEIYGSYSGDNGHPV